MGTDTKEYQEFQFGWLIFLFLLPAQAVIAYLYVNDLGDRPLETNWFIIIEAIFFLIYLLFYGLTTKVSSETVTVSFGIGIIRKRISIKRIKTIETVKNAWYYGWGIRFIPNGMLYNISGFDGVELRFNDTDRVIRIGSADSARLKNEIVRRLG